MKIPTLLTTLIFLYNFASAQVSVWDIPKTEILINQNVTEHGKQVTRLSISASKA